MVVKVKRKVPEDPPQAASGKRIKEGDEDTEAGSALMGLGAYGSSASDSSDN